MLDQTVAHARSNSGIKFAAFDTEHYWVDGRQVVVEYIGPGCTTLVISIDNPTRKP